MTFNSLIKRMYAGSSIFLMLYAVAYFIYRIIAYFSGINKFDFQGPLSGFQGQLMFGWMMSMFIVGALVISGSILLVNTLCNKPAFSRKSVAVFFAGKILYVLFLVSNWPQHILPE